MQYTDKQTIENYLLKEIDDSFDAQLGEWIIGMSKFIDNACNRVIFREEEETLLYDGDGTNLLIIKDVIDPTVTVDGASVEVYKYPVGKPYTSRIVLGDGSRFSQGYQNVAVTGIQAMSDELPEDIKFACTVLVAGIIRGQLNGDKEGTSEKIGSYTITYNTPKEKADLETAKSILSSNRRIAL